MTRTLAILLLLPLWFAACAGSSEPGSDKLLHEMDSLRIEMLIYSTKVRKLNRETAGLMQLRFESGYCPDSLARAGILTRLETLQVRMAVLHDFMDEIGADLDRMGDYDSLSYGYRHAADKEIGNVYWLGESHEVMQSEGKGKSRELRELLNRFSEWCRREVRGSDLPIARRDSIALELRDIARPPGDNPAIPDKFREWSFGSYTFFNKPLLSDMANFEAMNFQLERQHMIMLDFLTTVFRQACGDSLTRSTRLPDSLSG